jgi:hypothetical protein
VDFGVYKICMNTNLAGIVEAPAVGRVKRVCVCVVDAKSVARRNQ